jgi:hemolysin-activating ACP:hemolysin acyltransferase
MNDVEAAVHLVGTAKVYKDIFKGDVEHILQQVLPPIKLNQYRVFRRGDRPFAYTSWAFMNNESSKRFKRTGIIENESWWNNGKHIWHMDTICNDGSILTLHRWTQRNLAEQVGDKQKINWIRLGYDKFGEVRIKKQGYAFTKGEKNYGFDS